MCCKLLLLERLFLHPHLPLTQTGGDGCRIQFPSQLFVTIAWVLPRRSQLAECNQIGMVRTIFYSTCTDPLNFDCRDLPPRPLRQEVISQCTSRGGGGDLVFSRCPLGPLLVTSCGTYFVSLRRGLARHTYTSKEGNTRLEGRSAAAARACII